MRRRTALPNSTRSRNAAAAALALMLGASACGQAAASADSTAAEDGTSENATFADYKSPIADFMGVDFDSDDQQDKYLAVERDRNDWVTTCMANEGFEYRSTDPTVWMNDALTEQDGPAWGTDEWVAIYGFGMSTQMFEQETVGTDLVGSSYGTYEYTDPNDEYLSTLSDVEQSAYWSALYGDNSYDWDSTLSDEENDAAANAYFESVVETGCDPLSYESVSAVDPYAEMYEAFGDELGSMYQRVESDPAMVKAYADISRCAADAGFNFTNEQAMQEEIQDRLNPVQNAMVWPTDGMDSDDWDALTDDARLELERQQPTLSAEGKAILAEVQQYEIELATAVYGCGFGEMINLHQEVMLGYEQDFIDAHRADLESIRDNN